MHAVHLLIVFLLHFTFDEDPPFPPTMVWTQARWPLIYVPMDMLSWYIGGLDDFSGHLLPKWVCPLFITWMMTLWKSTVFQGCYLPPLYFEKKAWEWGYPHGDLEEAGSGSRFASHQNRSKLKFQDSVAIGTTTPCTHRALCSSDLRSTVSELWIIYSSHRINVW